jgi:hypothetical protein
MKKFVLAAYVALSATAGTAAAADLDRDIGLIVSGVVDKWAGVQMIDDGRFDETVFASGGAGYLSLPLGSNLSIQSDVKYEYNERAFDGDQPPFGPRYSFTGATHLSLRDPSTGLIGTFGGVGVSNWPGASGSTDIRFVGGEAQLYAGDFTFYAQGGYIDFEAASMSTIADEGLFARGVVRWFLDNGSRLQVEGNYVNADKNLNAGNFDAFSVGARYDFNLAGMPVIGDLPLYVAYRGTLRDSCVVTPTTSVDVDDHTFMIGTSYSFSGDRLTIDRHGATLDTPDFSYDCRGRQ